MDYDFNNQSNYKNKKQYIQYIILTIYILR